MGGVGYGIGSLNKNWNKRDESFSKAYQRGYEKTRDGRRGILREGYKKAPILTGASEAIGAGLSPIKFTKVSQTAPLSVIKRKNLLDAVSNGSVYGAGISENTAQNYAKNISRGIVGNYAGFALGEKFYGRGNNRPLARAVMSGLSDNTISSIYDIIPTKKK